MGTGYKVTAARVDYFFLWIAVIRVAYVVKEVAYLVVATLPSDFSLYLFDYHRRHLCGQ